ncbi:MAG: SPOR domain-containing protein, partial [Methylococcaceae bacterium]
ERPDQADDFPDFDSLGDDFDASDLIQDDAVEATSDLAPPKAQQQVIEPASEAEQPDQADDFPDFDSLGDDFDASDLIQDDDVEASASAALSAGKEEVNGLQDDDNNFDSLLMEAGLDTEDAQEQTAGKKDEFGDDADLDDFFQLDEVSDDFSNEKGEVQLEETAQDNREDDFLLPDFDITADTEISDDMKLPDMGGNTGIEDELANVFGDSDFSDEDEVTQTLEPETTELKPETGDTDTVEHASVNLSPFEFEHEDLKKQLDEAEKKVKKTKLFGYAALGFGAVAVSAAVGLGVMTYSAKNEVSKLTETVSTLEANLAKSAASNPHEEINAMRNSVVQLNQQLDGFITELKETPQFPVDLLNSKVPDIAAKQGMVSKALDMLQAKMGGEEKLSSAQPVIEPAKAEAAHEHAPAKEGPVHESAAAKEATAHKTTPPKEESAHEVASAKEGSAHEIAPTKDRALHEAALAPAKIEAVHEAVPTKVKVEPEPVKAKPITAVKAVVKEEAVSVEKPTVPGKWGVNLVAVKQEWYANSKVAEFARRGIYAEIVPVQGNNMTMYRLRVGGFKSKAEATSNIARIKQALNLDSVWVSDN